MDFGHKAFKSSNIVDSLCQKKYAKRIPNPYCHIEKKNAEKDFATRCVICNRAFFSLHTYRLTVKCT